MNIIRTILILLVFTTTVKSEAIEYYDLETPINLQQKTNFDYNPPSSLKPNTKKFIDTPIPDNIKYNYSINTNSMPKGIYRNRFIYTNAPYGGLTPIHTPSFDTQFPQY